MQLRPQNFVRGRTKRILASSTGVVGQFYSTNELRFHVYYPFFFFFHPRRNRLEVSPQSPFSFGKESFENELLKAK